jgi:hypothetical protein
MHPLGSGERDLAGLTRRRAAATCAALTAATGAPAAAGTRSVRQALTPRVRRRRSMTRTRAVTVFRPGGTRQRNRARPPRSGLTCRTRAARDGVRDSSTTRARDPAPTTRTPTLTTRAPSTPYAALTTGRVRPAAVAVHVHSDQTATAHTTAPLCRRTFIVALRPRLPRSASRPLIIAGAHLSVHRSGFVESGSNGRARARGRGETRDERDQLGIGYR